MTTTESERRNLSPSTVAALVLSAIALIAVGAVATLLLTRDTSGESAAISPTTPAPTTGATSTPPTETGSESSTAAATGTVAETTSAAITELASEPARFYAVAPSVDSLNVRRDPGTSGEIVDKFSPGMVGIYTTGRRVSVDGTAWSEIILGDDADTAVWVASQYLVADNTTLDLEPSVWCYFDRGAAGTRTIALAMEDASFTGAIKFRDASGVIRVDRVFGDRTEPDYGQALIVNANNDERMETWFFGETALGNGDAHLGDFVDCNAVAGDVLDIMSIVGL